MSCFGKGEEFMLFALGLEQSRNPCFKECEWCSYIFCPLVDYLSECF